MNRTEAHELLNAAQAGVDVSRRSITLALLVTGDLAPLERAYQPADTSEVLLFPFREAA